MRVSEMRAVRCDASCASALSVRVGFWCAWVLVRAMRGDGGRACGRKAAGAMPDSSIRRHAPRSDASSGQRVGSTWNRARALPTLRPRDAFPDFPISRFPERRRRQLARGACTRTRHRAPAPAAAAAAQLFVILRCSPPTLRSSARGANGDLTIAAATAANGGTAVRFAHGKRDLLIQCVCPLC